jgi:recombination protein RecA
MKIGVMFGNPETTSGGNALKYYASVRLDIRRTETIKDGDQATGNHVKVKVVKNKVAAPFKIAEFDIMFNEGISTAGDLIDLAVKHELVGKAGAWFSYKDEKIGQGREAAKQFLKEHPEVMEELDKQIRILSFPKPTDPKAKPEVEGEPEADAPTEL